MTEKSKKSEVSFEMYEWIKDCRPYHLTLGDVLKWKKGEKVDVCMLDGNFEEYGDIWNGIEPGKVLPATTFFAKNKATLTYKGAYVWDIAYNYGETIEHPIHFWISGLVNNENTSGNTIRRSWWVPLDVEKGSISIKTLEDGVPFPRKIRIQCQELPKSTKVGWRGPMILWKHLSILSKVHWNDD